MLPEGALQGLPSQGAGGAGGSSAPRAAEEPSVLLSSSLQPDVGKLWVSVPALSSLLFLPLQLQTCPKLCHSVPVPGLLRKPLAWAAAWEGAGRKEGDGRSGEGRAAAGVSAPCSRGEGRRMFCNIWRALPRAERGRQGRTAPGEPCTGCRCAGTGASRGNARSSCRLLPGPHWCHAVKMCFRLEFGSLGPDGEKTSPLTEGVGAAALGRLGEVMGELFLSCARLGKEV